MDILTSVVLSGIAWDGIKEVGKLTGGVLKDKLRKWTISDGECNQIADIINKSSEYAKDNKRVFDILIEENSEIKKIIQSIQPSAINNLHNSRSSFSYSPIIQGNGNNVVINDQREIITKKVEENKKIDEDEIYLSYLEQWCKYTDLNNWNAWTSWMLGSGQPRISQEMMNNLGELREWLFSRIWPGKHKELEASFTNFGYVLNDLYNKFDEHSVERGTMFQTEKFYKVGPYDRELYNKLLKEFNFHVSIVQDLVLELTRAANYICDNVRKFIMPRFRLDKGKLLVTYGPCMDLSFKTICTEYIGDERILIPYPGLEEFKSIRTNRDHRFGIGVSPEDPVFLETI